MYNIITNKRKPNNLELEGINLEEEFKSKGIITLYNKVQLIFVPSVLNKTFFDNTDNFKLLLNNLEKNEDKIKASKNYLKHVYNLFTKYNSLDENFISNAMKTIKETKILSQEDIENHLIDYINFSHPRYNGIVDGLLSSFCLAYHDNMNDTFKMYKNIVNNISFKYKEDWNLSRVLKLKPFQDEAYFLAKNIYKEKKYINVNVGDDKYLIKIKKDVNLNKLELLLNEVNKTSNNQLLNQMLNELNKHYNFNPKLPTVENNEKLKLEFTSIYLIKKDIDYNAIEKMLYDFKNKDNDKVMKDFMSKF